MRWLFCCLFLILTPHPWGRCQDAPADPTKKVADATVEIAPVELAPELAEIQAQSTAFVEAYNQHDAKAIAALWTADAEYVSDSGTAYVGQAAIEQFYAEHFLAHPDSSMRIVIDSLRQLSDGVAIEDGRAIVSPPPAGSAGVSAYTAVHVKVDGQWRMASVRDAWVDASITRDSSVDLEFLIGDWVAEEHGVQMHSVCRWIADGHFVARTYSLRHVDGSETSGMQLIGWNPVEEQMQSWMFSPDGGYAVGVWSLTPTGWAAETRGATGEGIETTSLNRLSRLDDNAYVWQSTQRTAGGVSLPDTDEVVIKRTPAKK